MWILRVMQCKNCRKTHRELPDWIIPYKRCSAEVYADAAQGLGNSCDGRTNEVIRLWVEWFLDYALHVLSGIRIENPEVCPIPDSKLLPERLMYFVRLVVNSGNWVHNRSAVTVAG